MRKIICLMLSTFIIMTLFSSQCFAASVKTVKLDEDWRLTGELDINAGSGNTIVIDGQGKYTIYEMLPGAILKNTTGMVRLKDVQVISVAAAPSQGFLAALSQAAAAITSVTAPAKDGTALVLPASEGFSVAVEASSNTGVIALDGTITPPATQQTVSLVFKLSENGGEAFTRSISVTVPAKTGSSGDESRDTGESPGGSAAGATPAPSYKAAVTGTGTAADALQVTVDTDRGSAAVDIGAMAGDLFTGREMPVVTVPAIPGVNSYILGLPASSLSASRGEGALTFSTGIGSITIPDNMLSQAREIEGKKVEITIGQGDRTSLPGDVKAAIGDRPLVQLTLAIDGQQSPWSNPDTPVTVAIPYTPTAEELKDPEHIVVWYIDGSGKATSVPSGRYDPATGTVIFTTTHFSYYGVAYIHKTFEDLGSVEWARKAIEAMASRGIINGTGGGSYSPAANITRADFMMLLVKTLGLTADFDGNFDDVKPGAYYYDAVGIAKKLGLSTGAGNNKFNPEENISRQDMATMTARALEKFKKLKGTGDIAVLDKFSDRGDIADYAANSLSALIEEGLVTGSESKLHPRAQTTRAEAAVLLHRIYNKY